MGFIVAVLFQLTPNFAKAQYFTGPIASSLGGAGRASGDTGEGTFMNPAILAHAPLFEASAYLSSGKPLSGGEQRVYGLTISDNSPNVIVPGALSYIQTKTTREGQPTIEGKYWQAAFGTFYMPGLSFGLSLNYLDQELAGAESYDQINGSAGILYVPKGTIGIGLTYHNFISASAETPQELQLVPVVGLGFNYLYEKFLRVRADITRPHERFNPNKEFNYHFGIESKAGEYLILRVGHQWAQVENTQVLTAGLGFAGPRLKVDYSYEKSQLPGSGALHSVDLRIGFW